MLAALTLAVVIQTSPPVFATLNKKLIELWRLSEDGTKQVHLFDIPNPEPFHISSISSNRQYTAVSLAGPERSWETRVYSLKSGEEVNRAGGIGLGFSRWQEDGSLYLWATDSIKVQPQSEHTSGSPRVVGFVDTENYRPKEEQTVKRELLERLNKKYSLAISWSSSGPNPNDIFPVNEEYVVLFNYRPEEYRNVYSLVQLEDMKEVFAVKRSGVLSVRASQKWIAFVAPGDRRVFVYDYRGKQLSIWEVEEGG